MRAGSTGTLAAHGRREVALSRPKARLIALAGAAVLTASFAVTTVWQTAAAFVAGTIAASTLGTLHLDPPASQGAPVSAAAGVVDLSWTATPTDPGAGRTVEYLVLRRDCCSGSYAQVGLTSALAHSDTPPSDGSYEYVIVARVVGTGGSFDSADSAARTGLSDSVAPAMAILCDGAACGAGWYTAAVSVTVSGTDSASGMGSVSHRIDGGSWMQTSGDTVIFDLSGDSTGHAVDYYGTDVATNVSGTSTQTIRIDATPPSTPTLSATALPPPDCGAPITVTTNADAWIDQGSPTSNKGDDSILKVMSKGPSSNLRALVGFALPTPPAGCALDTATLRLYAGSFSANRTIQALRVTGSWTENGVTWNNQPATTGPAATTTSGNGYRTWDVAGQVQAMYDTGISSGFLIRDAVENQDHEQQFFAREKDENPPELVITFAAPGPVEFSWTAATDATSGVAGYTLYWAQADPCPASSPASYPSVVGLGLVTSYTLPGTTNLRYCGYVVSHDVAGNTSADSNVASAVAQ